MNSLPDTSFPYIEAIHVSEYDFIKFLNTQYDDFKEYPYPYSQWKDALLDYFDIWRFELGVAYEMRKPDNQTPYHFINDYLTEIFDEYFPNKKRIYIYYD